MADDEQFIESLLAKPDKAEALSWLKGGEETSFRNLGELPTNAESVALVQHVYDLGASEVTAVEIWHGPDGSENSGKLVITLPENTSARQKIFQWAGIQAADLGFDADLDTGQRHLFVMLD